MDRAAGNEGVVPWEVPADSGECVQALQVPGARFPMGVSSPACEKSGGSYYRNKAGRKPEYQALIVVASASSKEGNGG